MLELDDKARLFLNLLQDEIPLIERPYARLAQKAGMTEDEAVALLSRLKHDQVLRQVSAIFDTQSLGYHSSLVACKAPPERMDEVAAVLNQHPGVSHNYARRHEFNLWFTIAVPPQSSLQRHVEILQERSGALSMRLLPTLRLFKIGMKLDLTGGQSGANPAAAAPRYSQERRRENLPPLSPRDIILVKALQDDMETRPDPFTPVARRAALGLEELFEWCRQAQASGRMRRIAGILNHRRAGFEANGMGIWKVPPERIEEAGAFFAAQAPITHCYLRPVYPDWPYNIFTMVHSRDAAACEALLVEFSRHLSLPDYAVLYSYKEYKKVRLRYFTGETEAWADACAAV